MSDCESKSCDLRKVESAVPESHSSSGGRLDTPPCCGPRVSVAGGKIDETVPGFLGWLSTDAGRVPRIGSQLTLADHLGACKARWGIGRMKYLVPPGLYAIGKPSPPDPVVVTANYRMSYDIVRRVLSGRNAWLLVLETFGINVWCAAGKGTFGTDELVHRIAVTGLARVVAHHRLILPILGAPGVAAHEIARRSGFSVSYGTIRAEDLPEYLDNGMSTTPAMREMTFSLYERLVLIPVEIVIACRSLPMIGGMLFLTALLMGGVSTALSATLAWLGAVLTGLAISPLLLPWIPVRGFALKGALLGIIWAISFYFISGGASWSLPVKAASFLILPSISAFYSLNFTGCTNFTSRSGVKREMKTALPMMGGMLFTGVILLLTGRFL